MSVLSDAWDYFLHPPSSAISSLSNEEWLKKGVTVLLKRDDLLFVPSHPEIAGNKWRKMWGTFAHYDRERKWPLITQGGIHSNHLVALAAAGHFLGVKTVGIVRGENNTDLSPTLQKAVFYGMELHFISRNEYKALASDFLPPFLLHTYPHFHFIPEGGSNDASALGMGHLMNELNDSFSQDELKSGKLMLAVPVGTGGTIKGLHSHNEQGIPLLGIYVLKGFSDNTLGQGVDLQYNFHLGGYAKYHAGLIAFMHDFYRRHHIVLDPIYSGKLLYALNELIKSDYFRPGTTLIAIHTGGLQGIPAFNKRYQTTLPLPISLSSPL
jgi:1-aminocyclopropane-1-carboxylate deaminase/D-cysteine desulfhydrase-like pyridoxal-dependent ACC family enzyme